MQPFEPYKIDTGFNKPASYGPHEGQDRNGLGGGNTDCGTPIKCVFDGVVIHTSDSTKDYGNLVVIESETPSGIRWTRYCHLGEYYATSGLVKRGDIIGTMGSTGNSTACHLHLDVLKKEPPHWRFYSKDVLTWYEDPDVIINLPDVIIPPVNDDTKRALEILEATKIEFNHGNLEGTASAGRGAQKDVQSLNSQITTLQEANTNLTTSNTEKTNELLRVGEENKKLQEQIKKLNESQKPVFTKRIPQLLLELAYAFEG